MAKLRDFDALKRIQSCDNPKCSKYSIVGAGNIRIHSRSKNQVYCGICKNRWVVTKRTIQFGLKTPLDKVIKTILMMAGGEGLRKTCRIQGITPQTAKFWIEKAVMHTDEFVSHMKKIRHYRKTEIELFSNFIKEKEKEISNT